MSDLYSAAYFTPTAGGIKNGATITHAEDFAVLVSGHGSVPLEGQGLLISGFINYEAGGATETVAVKCWQGHPVAAGVISGGVQVGPSGGLITAFAVTTVNDTVGFMFIDPTPTGDGQYTISANITSADGTYNYGLIQIESLQGAD